jgi:hypothetical protein
MATPDFVWRVKRKIDEMSHQASVEKDPAERRRLTAVAGILAEQLERLTARTKDDGPPKG